MEYAHRGVCDNCHREVQVKRKTSGPRAGKTLCSVCWSGGNPTTKGKGGGYRKQTAEARQHISEGTRLAIAVRKGVISYDEYGRRVNANKRKYRHQRYLKSKGKKR